ncbi:hypothetical protein SAMN04487941_3932 [Pontibacter akesuensis]|uniref:Uncharacterized protein n=1 Tax=Pontibacter akesuensis TaxID=388950 RepID=A0A1I7KPC6_9BACT|nr:hypothetical protein SAMN04487941_3932 [Pontibacter akesuensis]
MGKYFKIKLELDNSSAGLWAPIMANSAGEAVVKADERCFGTPFTICGMSVTEIDIIEYRSLLTEPAKKYNLFSLDAAFMNYKLDTGY